MIQTILAEGLVYGIMALGVFISFRLLEFPDLTVDGSFPLGAAIYASAIVAGIPGPVTLALIIFGGFAAGTVTALIHTKLRVPHLLAGILTMTMLYSVNLRVQGNRPNISFLKYDTLLDTVQGLLPGLGRGAVILIVFAAVVLLVKLILDLFFHTDMGLTMGAMGSNEQMVKSQGVNPETLKIIGLGLSNALVALSGALASQYQGSADVNLGRGIVIAGLASVMIGELVLRSNRIWVLTLRVIVGSILFRSLMFLARRAVFIQLRPSDLQLIYGLFIVGLLLYTRVQEDRRQKKAAGIALQHALQDEHGADSENPSGPGGGTTQETGENS
ncbi:ABC transporter permease [Salinispira pacifica]|uniref:ABC transporter permease protein n=1 Tax=Salinispira pacifica TaxID=1307761 RepID=V5WK76_9SPIO|nr:ABC transporter permease protein [Salinispira pacifica]AHC16025.1 ABC transporter permease protein [Salinispira pacifica]